MLGIKKGHRRFLFELGVAFASSLNYAGSYVLFLLWRLGIQYSVVISLAVSLIIGILVVDLTRSVVYTYISIILGSAVAILIISGPVIIEDPEMIDVAIAVAINPMVGLLLTNFAMCTIGVFTGCFLGEKLS